MCKTRLFSMWTNKSGPITVHCVTPTQLNRTCWATKPMLLLKLSTPTEMSLDLWTRWRCENFAPFTPQNLSRSEQMQTGCHPGSNTTRCVPQGCVLEPPLFQVFLKVSPQIIISSHFPTLGGLTHPRQNSTVIMTGPRRRQNIRTSVSGDLSAAYPDHTH